MEGNFLDELMVYVRFEAVHARVLAELKPYVQPAFPEIIERFYRAIAENARALSVFTGGAAQIERQKSFLAAWLEGLLSGRYDAEYLQLRARIGRTHVRIRLDQRYAIAAMSVVRQGLHDAVRVSDYPELDRPLAHGAIDKICDLELAIMLDTYAEDYSMRIRDKERLATLGQIAGFVGHELRNPLAVMETSLHLLKKRARADDEHAARHMQRLSEQLGICGGIISSLLELARDRPLERTEVALAPLIAAALESVAVPPELQLDVQLAPELPSARVDPKQLRQVLVNLVSNAVEALTLAPHAPRIEIAAQREGDALLLSVDDSGPGISEELRGRLFEPLATTRSKGLGLGLALCRRVAEKHDGDIRALRSRLGGARFELRFPGSFGVAP